VQTRIAEGVVSALAITLADPERQRMGARPTENLAAYETYMRGEQARTRALAHPASLARGAALLEEATAADPRFALAFAKLSLADRMIYEMFIDRTPERLASARAAADSALALDPALPEAHVALGENLLSDGDLARASAEFALAERGRPNDAEILARSAEVLARRGRWPAAMERVKRAAELDPRTVGTNLAAAQGFLYVRDLPSAMKYVNRALAADSGAITAYVMKANIQMLLAGDRAAARETAREIVFKFGAEGAAAAEDFDTLIPVLDTVDRATLARVPVSTFGGNLVLYSIWRMGLFQDWHPERARAYGDTLLLAAHDAIRNESGEYRIHTGLAWVHLLNGRMADAAREARRSMELMPASRDAILWTDAAHMAAFTYVRAGQTDAAIDVLEQLMSVPSLVSAPYLRTDPVWAPLRGNPRFERLVARGA
jgi:serine/threonine-protein kinase